MNLQAQIYVFSLDVYTNLQQNFNKRLNFGNKYKYRQGEIKEMIQQHLTRSDITKRYGVCQATLYNWLRAGKFPQGLKIARTRRWTLAEIESWEKTEKEVNN